MLELRNFVQILSHDQLCKVSQVSHKLDQPRSKQVSCYNHPKPKKSLTARMHSPASSMDPNFPKNYAMSTDLEGSRSFIMPSKYKVVQTKVQTSSL